MTTSVEIKDITKRYGTRTVLDTLNLEVEKGEFLTIVGPNGAGKTTLLRILACIEKPTKGELHIEGVKVDDRNRNQFRRKITMVFQRNVLFSTSVYNNIAYGLKLRNCSKEETNNRIKNALRLVKLEGYETHPANKLSGGEQQRVSLARALVLDTELLLLDEPTANLDPETTSIIEEAVTQVNREQNITVVMATHNMFQARRTTRKVALLLTGKITEVGTVDETFGSPSKKLATFTRLENVFSGTSKILEEGTSLIDIGNGLHIEASVRKSGKIHIFVRSKDIILSKRPLNSSARNVFKGRIVGITDLGSIVELRADIGKEFVVQITKRSFGEMALNLDSYVFLTFKASSVHVV
ncbi:MAG: ABC transporter ATP-binding protein [Candidatus Bathyarchaeota archaeon]|nr:MAG: ABC transporter ATP-binding protein [Candidatus Bathyarchaeota archaeon]